MQKRIVITEEDLERLESLVEGRALAAERDRESISALERELDRAEVVEASKIPRGVITMNSRVKLVDLDSGEEKVYVLVYPSAVGRDPNALSILAPIGTALLGFRKGDVIEWPVPRGIRRLKVLEVMFQPEAAAKAYRKSA